MAPLVGCADADEASLSSASVPIVAPVVAGSGQPNLTEGKDGSVLLSWIEPAPGGGHRLSFSRLLDGEWQPPRLVAAGDDWFVNWADFPSLIELPDGTLAAHFLQRRVGAERGYHYDVRIVLSDDGGASWSAPVTPHRSDVAAEYGFVSLFAAPDGDLGVVWLDGRMYDPAFGATEEMALRSTTVARDGSLGAEVLIDSRICDCCQTAVALTSQGPLVAYRDRSRTEIRDISISRLSEGRWSPPSPVHHDGWELAACPVNGPAMAARGDRVAVAWFTAARDSSRVLVAFSDDSGANFSTPIRVDEGDPLGRVAIGLRPDGGALIAWMERFGGDEAAIRYRTVGPDRAVSAAASAGATSAARNSGFPRMVVAGNQAVFAWTETALEPIVRTAVLRLEAGR